MRYATVLLFLFAAVPATAIPTRVSMSKLTVPVTVDGDLSDEAWRGALGIETFVEYFRGDNTAPPARTVGYLAYDAQSVYVAFFAADPSPRDIRAPLVDRDKVLGDQDYVAILIDTQNDRRSGVAFRVNPRGVQTDSVVNDANGEEDFSPDFFYEAVARRTPEGWAAEMRIPLASLRYPSSDPQSWGVIMMRNYPRDFRYIMSNTPIPKSSGCFLCHAATVSGIEGLPSGSHFTLTPYTTAANLDGPTAGFDLKWNPSTRLTIDTTLNPDFSQIEADVPQLSVNSRFALSYPEKRAFFLESVDLFDTPIQAVYTRSVTSPAWGMRATGRSGATAYTLLLAEDRGGGSVILPSTEGSTLAPQDFRSHVALGRLRRSFGNSFGAMLVSARENEDGGHNRVLGPDFLWKRSETDKVSGQLLYSSTRDGNERDSANGHAGRIVFERDAKRYDIFAAVSQYSPGFRADNGFVVQNGVRKAGAFAGFRTYPKTFVSYFRPYAGAERYVAYEGGETVFSGLYQGFYFEGKWGSSGWMTAMLEQERVGSKLLGRNSVEFNLTAAPRRWLPAIRVDGVAGQKIDYAGARVGTGATVNLGGTIRATDHLEMQLTTTREWLDLEEGRLFSASINWLKTTYTFSPRTLMRIIAQQNEIDRRGAPRDRSVSLSGLYAYKLNWQTVFFLGFGDSSITGERGERIPQPRSVFMKVAYALQR